VPPRATLELDQGNATGARGVLQQGVWASRDPRGTTSLWLAMALLEERAGDVGLARASMREALKRDRFAVDVRIAWAGLEARAGMRGEARQLFEGAVSLDPRNAIVRHS
jgi:Tfp pilus assembly protein PilF